MIWTDTMIGAFCTIYFLSYIHLKVIVKLAISTSKDVLS